MFQIQIDLLKQLDLNKKFGLYQMDLGLVVHCIIALGIYLQPELVVVEEEVGYKDAGTVPGWTKVIVMVVFLVLVEDEVQIEMVLAENYFETKYVSCQIIWTGLVVLWEKAQVQRDRRLG